MRTKTIVTLLLLLGCCMLAGLPILQVVYADTVYHWNPCTSTDSFTWGSPYNYNPTIVGSAPEGDSCINFNNHNAAGGVTTHLTLEYDDYNTSSDIYLGFWFKLKWWDSVGGYTTVYISFQNQSGRNSPSRQTLIIGYLPARTAFLWNGYQRGADIVTHTWYWVEMGLNRTGNHLWYFGVNGTYWTDTFPYDLDASLHLNFTTNSGLNIGEMEYDYFRVSDTLGFPPEVAPADVSVSSSPEINVQFAVNGTAYTTPDDLILNASTYQFIADQEHTYGGTIYEFDYWDVNSTLYYTSSISLTFSSASNISIIIYYLEQADNPVIPPIFDPDAVNATWYMRSDTYTTHEILGYKLHEYQSYTETSDSRYSSTENVSVSYGVKIWTLDASGNKEELSSGDPVAVVSRDDNSSGILSATWDCPVYSSVVDAVQVNVYQRFGSGAWSLRRIFISEEALLIRFPASTWTFHYYIEQVKLSTNSTFYHGSLSYASRMIFQYYRISVFEKMTYHLQQFQILSFLVTPWTYYLGTMFYGILLFFFATTAYLRYHSLKAVLAVFWLFGGTGGFLSAMMPAMGLQISWLILALTLTITIFHLIYGRRT